MNSSLSKVIEPYRKWITANPHLLSDIESTVRYLSYFTADHFNNPTFLSELIYSMPNLLVLFNDLLMYGNKCVHLNISQFESKVKVWLTVVEYTETLCEVSAKKLWGNKGKWIIIAVIQIFKTILRLLLVYVYKERVTKSPPIQPLNREKLNDEKAQMPPVIKLKRSGLCIRNVRSVQTTDMRFWGPFPTEVGDGCDAENLPAPKTKLILAESLYILKPLFHLGCVSVTGEKEWPPWLLSLVVDLVSLKIFRDEEKAISFSTDDRKEFSQRRLALLLYLLRSPFYDKYSRTKIHAILTMLSNNVPLARFVAEPVKKYLPRWQNMYFHLWSS